MADFTPTEEQLAVVEAAKNLDDNLLVSALAGAAKTSTLVLIAKALSGTPMLCLAFNKKIAAEMKERLPGNCESMTLNSLGHRALGRLLGRRLIVNTRKNYEILSGIVNDLPQRKKEEAFETFSETLKAVASGKTVGFIPDKHFPDAKRLMSDDDFFEWLEDAPSELQEELIIKATNLSIELGMRGNIDFDDQILLSTLFPASFSPYPVTLIDEAQDLSTLNHYMLRKIVRRNRLIAVGDECQAIYGFRGAHENSMRLLKREFDMKEYSLTISFRCPISVVKEARFRAPAMQYPDWAKEGSVVRKPAWTVDDIPQHAVIICRNNAPLFALAIKLLKEGRYPELVGNDIGKGLVKIMKKLGDFAMPQAEVFAAINAWLEVKLQKSRNPGNARDQADCMRVFAEEGATLGDAITYAEHLFSIAGPVKLMTGHKSKGLEFDDVFFLDQDLIANKGQDLNLRYVIITRSKDTLTYINSEGLNA